MTEQEHVVVIGAGQAGLAVSHELTHANIEHVVLERNRVADSWRRRWESFCLVIPNWTVQLPGRVYEGDDPHGFMPRDEIAAYLERYARSFRAPVREGVGVSSIESASGGLLLRTSEGEVLARAVIVASGAGGSLRNADLVPLAVVLGAVPDRDGEACEGRATLGVAELGIVCDVYLTPAAIAERHTSDGTPRRSVGRLPE